MRKVDVPSHIRNLISRLKYGQMFCTRDCLNFGPRAAVDQALYRLVKEGTVVRLARGVFTKLRANTPIPTAQQIAAYKAKAFFRKIVHIPKSFSRPDLLLPQVYLGKGRDVSQKLSPFASDGATSSFALILSGEKEEFKRQAPRKLVLGDTLHGLLIRRLWSLGKDDVSEKDIAQAFDHLGREDRNSLRSSCHIMPAWLAKLLVWNRSGRRRSKKTG
jgi:hypothetical protein